MNKELKEDDKAIKVTMPLLTEKEMLEIDNNFNEIVNKIRNQYIKEKDLAIAQYIIDRQQKHIEELEQKETILDKVTDSLDKLDKILKQDGIFGYDVEIRKILDIIEGEKK